MERKERKREREKEKKEEEKKTDNKRSEEEDGPFCARGDNCLKNSDKN